MGNQLNVLIVEDSEADGILLVHELEKAGYDVKWKRVHTESDFRANLQPDLDIILSDFNLPQFSKQRAIELFKESKLDIPFVIVSGTIGEERAVESLRAGATDYVLKDRIDRLGTVVERALREFKERTERKQAENTLRRTEELYRRAISGVNAVPYLYDYGSRTYGFIGGEIEQLIGYSPLEVTPELWKRIIQESIMLGETAGLDKEEAAQRVRAGKIRSWRCDMRVITRQGESRWISDASVQNLDESGRVTGSMGILQDITERKRGELRIVAFSNLGQKLSTAKTAKEAAEILVDTADQLFGWDACTLDLYSSETDRVHHVLNRDTIDGERKSFPPAYDNREPTPRARKVIEKGAQLILREASNAVPEVILFGDKSRLSASIMLVPIRDATKVIGVLSIQSYTPNAYTQQDLNTLQSLADHCGGALNRIQAEESLQESDRRFREMLANVEMIAMILDKNGRIMFCNDYLLQLTGWKREEVIGADWFEKFIPDTDTRVKKMFLDTIKIGAVPAHFENPIKTKKGEIREIVWNNTMLRDTAGNIVGTASLGEDVTERKRLEEQFLQAQKMESIGQLAGGVAHDFNNILTVIHGHAYLLLSDAKVKELAGESLEQISVASERAANLTRQLLTFSRKQVIQPRVLDLNEVVGNLTKMLKRVLGEDISLSANFSSNLSMIRADAGMMEQILMNLAVNARDAMLRGGELIVTTSDETFGDDAMQWNPQAKPGNYVCLAVSDTGAGIPPEVLPRIFEPFFTTKEVGKGTGLGLATVYGVVHQHHGWVTVYSEVGKGTVFRIYLPAADAREQQEAQRAAETEVRGGTETILLVEDEIGVRTLVRHVLVRYGYKVIEAVSGVAALQIWREQNAKIDLVLTDMVMPDGMSGRDLVQKLHAEKPSLLVIYSSGYSADAVGKDFELRDEINFLQKPYSPRKLARVVRNALDRAK